MPLLPIARARHFGKERSALSHTGTCGGGERNDRLSRKIVVLHEVVDRPCRDAPPDGVADKDRIVFVKVFGRCCDQRNVAQRLVIVFAVDAAARSRPAEVGACVGCYRNKLKKRSARCRGNVFRNPFGVAAAGEVYDKRFAASRRRVRCTGRVCRAVYLCTTLDFPLC